MDSYYPKYLKYKNKYLKLKSLSSNQNGGSQFPIINESSKMIDRQRKVEKPNVSSKLRNQLDFEESAKPREGPRKTDSRTTFSAEPKAEIKKSDSRSQQRAESVNEKGAEPKRAEEQRKAAERRAEGQKKAAERRAEQKRAEQRAEQKRAEERRAEQKRAEQRAEQKRAEQRAEQKRAEQRAEQKRAEERRAEERRVMDRTKKVESRFLSETSDEEPEMLSPTSSEFLSEIKQNNEAYKFRADSEEKQPKYDSMRESDVNMTETELNLPDKLIDSESEEKPKEISFIDKIKNFFKDEKEDSNEIKELGNEPDETTKISSVLDKKVVLSPLVVNQSFDRNDLEKVKIIDGITYRTKEEFTNRFWPCLFETCDLTWEKTKWTTIDKL